MKKRMGAEEIVIARRSERRAKASRLRFFFLASRLDAISLQMSSSAASAGSSNSFRKASRMSMRRCISGSTFEYPFFLP